MLLSPCSVVRSDLDEHGGPPSPRVEENLEALLEEGIRILLSEATRLSVLEPPHGRPNMGTFLNPFPPEAPPEEPQTPLVAGEEDDDDEDDSSEDEEEPVFVPPPYKFDYGFNPLTFLGRYLHRYHPRNIAKRKAEKKANFAYLCRRAEHGKRQLSNVIKLRGLMTELQSGILLGPLCGSASTDSAVFWARAIKPGRIVFEYSDDPDFSTPERARVDVTSETDFTARVQVDGLLAGRRYYCRACMVNPQLGFPLPPEAVYRQTKFTTMPDFPGPDHAVRFSFASTAVLPDTHSSFKPRLPNTLLDQIDAKTLNFFIFLGSLIPQAAQAAAAAVTAGAAAATTPVTVPSLADLRVWYRKAYHSHSKLIEPLKQLPVMVAWNDSSEGSVLALKAEEEQAAVAAAAEKKAAAANKANANSSSNKKVKIKEKDSQGQPSKPPAQPLRTSLQAFSEYFPVRNSEIRGQTFWKTSICNELIDMYFLDTRNGKIGLRQANWIIESVQSSQATWKILASPASAAYVKAPPPQPTPRPGDAASPGGDAESMSSTHMRLSSRSHKSTHSNSGAAKDAPDTNRSGASEMSGTSRTNGKSGSKHHSKKSNNNNNTGSSSSDNKLSSGASGASPTHEGAKEEEKVMTVARLVQRLQQLSIRNVLVLSGELPYPYATTLGPEHSDSLDNSKKVNTTYYEFGAGSLVDTLEDPEARRLSQKAYIKAEVEFVLKDMMPLMVGNYYGIVTVSRSGRIKYNVYSAKDGNKKQWIEIKPSSSH